MDGESLRLLLGQGLSVEKIARRFGKDPSTVAHWMHEHGLESPHRDKHAPKGGIERERLEALVEEGRTIVEIAEAVGLSKTAVRHWLRKYDLQTRSKTRRRLVNAARDGGHATVQLECRRHGMTDFWLEGRGYYRCKRCRAERVARRRRQVKQLLVDELGGCCLICGYDRYVGALVFHHLVPSEKRLQISWNGLTQSLAAVRAEVRKCVLLCSNCHAEVEAGVVVVPAKVDPLR
jgi:transposase-like protein